MTSIESKPTVTQRAFLSMQVCVPLNWPNDKIESFANIENLCGTEHGWSIRHGSDERVNCEKHDGFVHIILNC